MKKLVFSILAFSLLQAQLATAQNARLVKDLLGGPDGGFGYNDTRLLTNLGPLCLFWAVGESPDSRLICSSNGTSNGTISLLPPFSVLSNDALGEWVVAGGRFWFIINRADKAELYSSDGTFTGTKLRYSLDDARFDMLRNFQEDVIFRESPGDFTGDKIKRLDSDNLAQAPTTIGTFYWFIGLRDLCVSGNDIWAIGQLDDTERSLLKSDGSPNSLQKIASIGTGSDFNQAVFMTPVGNKVFWFWKTESSPYQLWVSDGTAAGTLALKEFDEPFFNDLRANRAIAALNGKLVFQAKLPDDPKGVEIWASDGSPAGTALLKDCAPDSDDSSPKYFTLLDGKLWFSARNAAWNDRLWSTDGTPAGTKDALSTFAWNDYAGTDMTVFNDSLAFGGFFHAVGGEVFLSKGTDASTKAVSDQSPANDDFFYPRHLVAAGGRLFFTAQKQSQGRELWIYDPNEAPVVSTQSVDNVSFAKVYPNPGRDAFTLETETGGWLEIFANDGKLIKTMPVTEGKTEIQTGDWQPGVFSGRLISGKEVRIFEWVKKG